MNGHYLTVKEWAAKNKLSQATVRNWCENMMIDGVERFGVEWAIPYDAPVPTPHYGKEQCIFLKQLRKKIAEQNEIEFEPKRCNHKGVCPGTCAACEAELAFLEEELKEKARRGERISLDGIGIDEILEFNNRIISETDRFRELNDEIDEEYAVFGSCGEE